MEHASPNPIPDTIPADLEAAAPTSTAPTSTAPTSTATTSIAPTSTPPTRAPITAGDVIAVHPGLGAVILPPPPDAAPAPSGVRGTIRAQIERAIKFETDRREQREHARVVAIVQSVSDTRKAVIDRAIHQQADQDALTATIDGAVGHLRSLQVSSDSLREAVTTIGSSAHEHGVAIGDLGARLARIEARLDALTSAIELLAARAPAAS